MMIPFLEIKTTSNKGLGVFATENIPEGTLIEVSPVIVLNENDTQLIHKTNLYNYYFSWEENQKASAIALGYVSIYNHAIDANCLYETYFEEKVIKIITRKNIAKGEELTINYHHDPMSTKKTWFEIQNE
jgi:SET domain-containing protein